ncbi:AbrB/MazE/SpoVT family DNA-binding domain-containing protein [Azospirillum sp. A26]|uniref:AbrB/MazE/SpoVT family DNA-binding domain-containing protein n=1 Tax=Azospirillum sp. A26 TaxID=3160607 RepID=UPI00366B46E2
MLALKVITVGSSAGVILPNEALSRLKVQQGDTLFLTEAPDGSYRITPYDPEFERQMAIAEEIMHEDRDILRALADK